MECPKCGSDMRIIRNLKLDEEWELISVCDVCRKAFRGYPLEEDGRTEV